MNWVLPIGLVLLSMNWHFDAYRYPNGHGIMGPIQDNIVRTVGVTFICFWLVRFWAWRSGADRILYEIVALIGMIVGIVLVFRAPRIIELPYTNSLGITEYSEAKLSFLYVIVTITLLVLIAVV